jgi:putative oxidoreductase
MKILRRGYELLVSVTTKLQSPFLLIVRVYWGWQFLQAGWGKLSNIQKPIEYFTSLNIPMPVATAWFISLLEFAGGILLILGLGSRLISLLLAGDMLGAYIKADPEALKAAFSSDAGKFFAADEFSFLCAALVVLFFGPGKISLDYVLERRLGKGASISASAR